MLGRLQVAGSALGLDVLDTRGNRRMRARFRNHRNAGRDRVQIDVRAGGQQRFVIEDRDAFEAPFEERPGAFCLADWPAATVVPSGIS